MGKNQANNYFEMFVQLVDFSCHAAECLHKVLTEFNPATLPETMQALHSIEHEADNGKHALMEKLTKEFIPPIEREDIIALAQDIDNVTDAIEDVLMKMYMYNIQSIRPDAIQFSDTIVHCCKALKNMMMEFENYRKSICIHDCIVEINRLEEEGDKLYMDAVRNLCIEGGNPLEVYAWSQAFSKMEKCCDACEHTANVVESVIMKNS